MSPLLTGLPLLSGAEMLRAEYSLRLMSCRVAVRMSGTSGVICRAEPDAEIHVKGCSTKQSALAVCMSLHSIKCSVQAFDAAPIRVQARSLNLRQLSTTKVGVHLTFDSANGGLLNTPAVYSHAVH